MEKYQPDHLNYNLVTVNPVLILLIIGQPMAGGVWDHPTGGTN